MAFIKFGQKPQQQQTVEQSAPVTPQETAEIKKPELSVPETTTEIEEVAPVATVTDEQMEQVIAAAIEEATTEEIGTPVTVSAPTTPATPVVEKKVGPFEVPVLAGMEGQCEIPP